MQAILFFNFFPFQLIFVSSGRRAFVLDTVFYGRVRSLYGAATFDCGLANLSCMSRSVEVDMFFARFPLFRWPNTHFLRALGVAIQHAHKDYKN